MTQNLTIALDTVYDEAGQPETIEGVIADIEQLYTGVTGSVTDPSGPAGGWPVVEWTGERELMLSMLDEFYGLDESDVDYYTKTGTAVANADVADC